MSDDKTKPRRDDVFPPDYNFEQAPGDDYEDDESGGPGCLAWGIMGAFGLLIAIAIVISAILAGFNEGLGTAQVTAVAVTQQNIAQQCSIIPTDIAAGRFNTLRTRFESMTINGVLPDCAALFVPQATIVYEQSLITPTLPPTAFPTATPVVMATATTIVDVQPEVTPTGIVNDSGYDLVALLSEARDFIAQSDYGEAITTLDAVRAIDPNFETQTVNGLLFNALSQEALIQYRSDSGSLAEAILLTNRAEQFGDILATELPFERSVAELYLDARANLSLNYQIVISLLSQVVSLSPNYPRGTGEANTLLIRQYEGYGDALLAGGEPCRAESQFNTLLSYRPNDLNIQTKADTANEQCTFGVPASPDPNATIDPNATQVPLATATEGVAPIGQGG